VPGHRAVLAAIRARDGAAEAVAADLAFHRALLAASHNELLERMDQVLASGLAARDRLVHGPGHHPSDPVPGHRAVLAAIRARDPDAAEAAMHRLLAQAARDLAELSAGEPGGGSAGGSAAEPAGGSAAERAGGA
jgi:DNA-binding FadR family transcriptional regulator